MIAWEELDECQSVEEICNILRKHKIKATIGDRVLHCPLAVATGYIVGMGFRRKFSPHIIESRLTNIESDFIHLYDKGDLPEFCPEGYVINPVTREYVECGR